MSKVRRGDPSALFSNCQPIARTPRPVWNLPPVGGLNPSTGA